MLHPVQQRVRDVNRRVRRLTALHGVASFRIHVLGDAVSSRTVLNRELALDRMRHQGVVVSSTEMAIYEIMERAGTDQFRDVLTLVK